MSFPNCGDAYDVWKKQMGGSSSTKNSNPCNKNCYCARNSVKRVQVESGATPNNKKKMNKKKH